MSYVPPGQQQQQQQQPYGSTNTQAAGGAYNPQAAAGAAYDPQAPDAVPQEEDTGMSTGTKVAIGAVVGVGAVAAVAAGVGALAVGGYYLYDSHEAKQQNESQLKLHFRALSGHGLKSEDIGGKSDPYLEVEVGRVAVATKEIRGTLDPVWNEEMSLGIYPDHLEKNIEVSVKDKDRGRTDDHLGKAHVSFATIPANRPKRFDLALDTQGSVQVEMWVTGPGAKDGARVTPEPKRRHDNKAGHGHRVGGASHKQGSSSSESRHNRKQHRRDDDDDDFDDDEEDNRRHKRRAGRKSRRRSSRDDDFDDERDNSPVRHGRGRRDKARGAGDRGRGKGLRKLMSDGAYVHLTSDASGKNLRILRSGNVDAKGGKGKWAKFEVYREDGPKTFKLRNVGDDSHWLAIDGPEVCAEEEDYATVFVAQKKSANEIGLKCKRSGRWLAVDDLGMVSAKKKRGANVGRRVAFTIVPCD